MDPLSERQAAKARLAHAADQRHRRRRAARVSDALDGYFRLGKPVAFIKDGGAAPMRQVSLGPLPPGAGTEQTLDWLVRADAFDDWTPFLHPSKSAPSGFK